MLMLENKGDILLVEFLELILYTWEQENGDCQGFLFWKMSMSHIIFQIRFQINLSM